MGHHHSHHHRGHPGRGRGRGRACGRGRRQHHCHIQDQELQRQADELQRANVELEAKLTELSQSINNEPSNEYHDVDEIAALIGLAGGIDAVPMNNRSFGLFGVTSAGKSTIINKLIGEDVAEVGAGETTTVIQSYEGSNYTLCDMPGLNDHMSYFTVEYISFWKGLTGRLVVITTTVNEVVKLLRLFDGSDLAYDIIVNKLDDVDAEHCDHFKETIRKQVGELCLKKARRIWFVSAKNPDQFPDWLDMVDDLTTIN